MRDGDGPVPGRVKGGALAEVAGIAARQHQSRHPAVLVCIAIAVLIGGVFISALNADMGTDMGTAPRRTAP